MTATATVPGLEKLIAVIDEAVVQPSCEKITHSLKIGLQELILEGQIVLPQELCSTCQDHYGRRLLYRSPEHGYAVVAMVWGPGQGTALHDHAGTWCVEGVLEGEIEVTQYDLLENGAESCRFSAQGTVRAGVASAGSLIPPFEYHTIFNAHDDSTSITLHVYGRELETCTIFQPLGDGWYQRQTRQLTYH